MSALPAIAFQPRAARQVSIRLGDLERDNDLKLEIISQIFCNRVLRNTHTILEQRRFSSSAKICARVRSMPYFRCSPRERFSPLLWSLTSIARSLARYGPWPWSRLRLANLLQKIAQAKPRVVGIDILLSEPDRLSPARLARDLGIGADGEELAKLASKLPDGDAAVADALRTRSSRTRLRPGPDGNQTTSSRRTVSSAWSRPGAGHLAVGRCDRSVAGDCGSE